MKDWQTYSKSAVGNSESAGRPSVREYLLIKLADNWIAVAVLVLFLICTAAGVASDLYGPASSKAGQWCFDSAKLCLGVFLGLLKR
jgi:hypothetical protein